MADYRLVRNGEMIRQGDQPLLDDCKSWGFLAGWEVGRPYNPSVMVPLRRATPSDKEGGE